MTAMKKMVLGSDHAGFSLKQKIAEYLRERGFEVIDVGCLDENSVDYPAISAQLAKAVQTIQSELPEQGYYGILCCGSGIGVCITVNRFPWIRAVEAHDHNTAILSRRHNNSNVLCLGGRILAPELAFTLIETWLETPFDGGRHQKRVDMMTEIQVDTTANALMGGQKEISTC